MFYLAGKILIFLLIAAILGILFGRYLRRIFIKNNTANAENIKSLELENEELKQKLEKCYKNLKNHQEKMNVPQKSEKDDLQKIRGIGKVLELKLNQLGIFSFEQISKWDKSEIEKISKEIGPFRDRIERDNWISQAKKMLNI